MDRNVVIMNLQNFFAEPAARVVEPARSSVFVCAPSCVDRHQVVVGLSFLSTTSRLPQQTLPACLPAHHTSVLPAMKGPAFRNI